MKVSLIMPALNEQDNVVAALRRCLEAFDQLALDGEVVVINDGSTDQTEKLVKDIQKSDPGRVKLIRHDQPQGIGASFRDGVAGATGEVVAMMPGDNENDPTEILRYLPLLKEVDFVVPFVFNKEVRGSKRNFYSSIYLAIVNLSFRQKFNYTNGTVLYRRCILEDSPNRSNGFFFQTENLVRAARRGYLFAEVPYRLDVRESGESKATSLASLKVIVKDYLELIREIYFSEDPAPPVPGSAAACQRGRV